jgi:IclR family transcriptional regulator, pca regulon regulatory protein
LFPEFDRNPTTNTTPVPRPRTSPNPETPKVLDKALRILDAFGQESTAWSEAALRDHVDIPSSTLNRILRSLESAGYLMRGVDGRYRLGVAAIRLGRRASASLDLPTALDPHLRELAQRTQELVILAVPDLRAGRASYMAIADCPKRLRVTAEIGTKVPLTAGATAKTILAFRPQPEVDAVLERPPTRLAAGTIIDRSQLRRQLTTIARRGWGLSWEETYDGAWAVAAPVRDDEGHALGAFGVATPISRHSRAVEKSNRDAVIDVAARAGSALRLGQRTEHA